MKKTRIGINGFGRRGRLSFRAGWGWPDFEWAFTESATPRDAPWAEHGVEIVLECSGRFSRPEDLRVYFEHGVTRPSWRPAGGGGAA